MDAVGRLAGGIAHDFNNLLAAVIGYADLLQYHEGVTPDIRADARSISTSAKRGADLARNLLTLARRHPTRRAPVVLDAVVKEVVGIASRTFDRRIVLQTDLRVPDTTLLGDASELSSALLNLAVNARDAMPEGGRLTFSTSVATLDSLFWRGRAEEAMPGEYIVVSVSDTGSGMSPETRARAFEPFFTTKDVGKGTGLGLAMVYSTVLSHRGIIDVTSAIGRGTTFTLYFPTIHTSPEAESVDEEPVPGTGRILLADDDASVRDSTARMLRALGYDVDTVPNGVDAIARVREETRPYDLVIVDGNMPILSGRDTALRMRDLDPRLPVLLISGYMEHALGEDADTAAVFSGILTKPFSWPQLSRTVASYTRSARATSSSESRL
jgi:CheY-like chemotaxis protein